MDVKAKRQLLARNIIDLEHKIITWDSLKQRNDSKAVAELNNWKKELSENRSAYKALKKESDEKKAE